MSNLCNWVLVFLSSAVLADAPPQAVPDEGGYLAKANAGLAAYESIKEWGGTFLYEGSEPDKNGRWRVVRAYRIRMEVIEPKWRMELSVLGEKGEVESRVIEVFDGTRNWVYLDQPDERVGSVYTHVEDRLGSWLPSHPKKGMSTGAQEVRFLVMGGSFTKSSSFSYYAGRPKGAPKGTQAFVRLGKDGWPGWRAIFLDPSRQYIPVEIWRGNTSLPGRPKIIFSAWKVDEKGRPYAGEMRHEFVKPKQAKVGIVCTVTAEQFTRTVDPRRVERIEFPKGTEVMLEHDPDSRYVVGEK